MQNNKKLTAAQILRQQSCKINKEETPVLACELCVFAYMPCIRMCVCAMWQENICQVARNTRRWMNRRSASWPLRFWPLYTLPFQAKTRKRCRSTRTSLYTVNSCREFVVTTSIGRTHHRCHISSHVDGMSSYFVANGDSATTLHHILRTPGSFTGQSQQSANKVKIICAFKRTTLYISTNYDKLRTLALLLCSFSAFQLFRVGEKSSATNSAFPFDKWNEVKWCTAAKAMKKPNGTERSRAADEGQKCWQQFSLKWN